MDPVDPWALTTAEELAQPETDAERHELALTIGRRNIDAIRSCTLLVAHLDGQEPDSGTAAEVGYAAALGLTCFGLRTDLRQSGEPGVAVNLQLQTFISDSGGTIAATLDDLVEALRTSGTAGSR